jgi:hypothetical protein
MRSKEPPVKIQERQLVDKFLKKTKLAKIPVGEFFFKGKVDGKKVSALYFFSEDQSVTKEITYSTFLNKYRLSGTAKYRINGAVIQFYDIAGDRVIFSPIGEPISIISKDKFISHASNGSIQNAEFHRSDE